MNRAPEGQPQGNWLTVRPRMSTGANHFAIGTLIHATVGDTTMMRLITAGTSMQGQEPAEAHFGLADHTTIDQLTIRWPDGQTTTLNDVPANQLLDITTPPAVTCLNLDLTDTGIIDADDLNILLNAYGTSDPTIDFDNSGTVDMPDLALLLQYFGQTCP
jgi:hypothetical protein